MRIRAHDSRRFDVWHRPDPAAEWGQIGRGLNRSDVLWLVRHWRRAGSRVRVRVTS